MEEEMSKKILEFVNEEELLNIAKDLVKIPSFSAEETPVAWFLAKWMEDRGFEVDIQEVEDCRFQAIGRLKGSGGGYNLVYNGHVDIDGIYEGLKEDPFRPVIVEADDGRRFYGQGISNMKGGDAVFLAAASAVNKAGIPLKGDLIVAPVVGELQGGVGTRHFLNTYPLKKGVKLDMAVVTEPCGADVLCTVHAGWMQFQINFYGKMQHATNIEKRRDAIKQAMKSIDALYKTKFTYTPRDDLPALPRLMVSTIIGGRSIFLKKENKWFHDLRGGNFSSDLCTIIVDVRYVHSQTPESVKADLVKVLEELRIEDPNFNYDVRYPPEKKFECSRVTMLPFDASKDEEIVQTVRRNYKYVTGKEPKIGATLPDSYSGNDTTHFWHAGIPCLLYGPAFHGEWGPQDETMAKFHPPYLLLDEMILCTKVLALTAAEICTKEKN